MFQNVSILRLYNIVLSTVFTNLAARKSASVNTAFVNFYKCLFPFE